MKASSSELLSVSSNSDLSQDSLIFTLTRETGL